MMTSIMTLLTLGMTSFMKIMNSKYHTIYGCIPMVKEVHETQGGICELGGSLI